MTEMNGKYWLTKDKSKFSRNTEKNKKFYSIFLLVISFFLVISIVAFYLNKQKNNDFSDYTETNIAVVTDIRVRYVKVNDMDGTTVFNYTISYEFTSNKQKIKGVHIVDRYFYDNYFDKKLKIKDTITILYNPERPELSMIKKQF